MRPTHRTLGPRQATGTDRSTHVSLASLLVTFVAIAMAPASFGVLSLAPAAVATLLARRARDELGRDSPTPAHALAAIAWWAAVVVLAFSLVALVILLLDVAGVDELGERVVEKAH
jgi:hypothetical protein